MVLNCGIVTFFYKKLSKIIPNSIKSRVMQYFMVLIVLIFTTGCSVKYEQNADFKQTQAKNIYALTSQIKALDSSIDLKEAQRAATISILYPLSLAKSYELTSPPLWHNSLINMNIKQRGFCYHFAQDLAHMLKKRTFSNPTHSLGRS
jgi:hypothetical protein